MSTVGPYYRPKKSAVHTKRPTEKHYSYIRNIHLISDRLQKQTEYVMRLCCVHMLSSSGGDMTGSVSTSGTLARLARYVPICESICRKLDTVWSMENFNVEYGGFLSNHLAHGVIAFERLGATDERIEQFVKEYTEKLEPPSDDIPYQHDHHRLVEHFDSELLGARRNWYGLLRFYKRETTSIGWQGAVRQYFPMLSDGVAGSALHGLIQLGYGCHARSAQLVAEGLAYLHMAHLPFRTDSALVRQSDCLEMGAILEKLRDDGQYKCVLEEETDRMKARMGKTSTFQARMAVLSAHRQAELASLSSKAALHGNNPAQWMLDAAIDVYTRSAIRNDFFLLHGVTGAWALKQIISQLPPDEVLRATQQFLAMYLAVYIARGSPPLNTVPIYVPTEGEWNGVCKRALSIHHGDEHVQKLVQVCAERAAQDTPEKAMWPVCFAAAQQTTDYPFHY